MRRLRKTAIIVTFLLLLASPFGLTGQESDGANAGNNESLLAPFDKIGYDSGSLDDFRIEVKNISFSVRFKDNGRGQILDVIFDIHNTTQADLELSYSVFAFQEMDLFDKFERQLIPFPKWREDPDKSANQIYFGVAAPVDVTDDDRKDMWTKIIKDDYELCMKVGNQKETCEFQRLKKNAEIDKYSLYPPMYDIARYIQDNQQKFAKPFKLASAKASDAPVQILDTPEKQIGKIYHSRNMSTVISSHESLYRPDFHFFNKVLILIFEPGSKKVLYRRFYEFKRPIKAR